MNKKIKKKWLAALRSGKYKQAKGKLRRSIPNTSQYKHCCLGVLCDIYRKETGKGEFNSTGHYVIDGEYGYGILPEAVRDWAGLTRSNPEVKYGGGNMCIASVNDMEKVGFERIADLIEESL